MTYEEFIAAKVNFEHSCGLSCDADEINPLLKPHQRDIVQWAIRGGRRAIFAAFGLGKTFMQLEIARLICEKTGQPFLICAPLGVRQEFRRDAEKLGIPLMHLCPLQFDLADRVITQLSMPGEVVLDPFAGLMTVPLRAIKLKRYGIGIELNSRYFVDGAAYCKAEEQKLAMPDLFALDEPELVEASA